MLCENLTVAGCLVEHIDIDVSGLRVRYKAAIRLLRSAGARWDPSIQNCEIYPYINVKLTYNLLECKQQSMEMMKADSEYKWMEERI